MTLSHNHKNRNTPDALSSEHLPVASTLSWKGYIVIGSLLFMVFYWIIPAWLNHELSTLQNSTIRPIAEALLMRHIHWMQLAGIALSAICTFFAIHNYYATRAVSKS